MVLGGFGWFQVGSDGFGWFHVLSITENCSQSNVNDGETQSSNLYASLFFRA